jgi:hypothetical protein
VAGAAGGAAAAAPPSTTLSRARRHSYDIMDAHVFKPLGLSADFVPHKSCREYLLDECARALPEIRPHAQALAQTAREVMCASAARGNGFGSQSSLPVCER